MFHILVTLNEVKGPVISSLLRRPEDRRDEGPSEFLASHLRHPDP